MSTMTQMQVEIRVPGGTLFKGAASRLGAVGQAGSFGILPNHVDFVNALVPSVLLITQSDDSERFFGIDEGILVKKGHNVEIAVRRGIESADLETMQQVVGDFFEGMEDDERVARAALSRLEADMVRRFAGLRTQL